MTDEKKPKKGCWNCNHQIEPLRACEWLEKGGAGVVHMTCPRWVERKKNGQECMPDMRI